MARARSVATLLVLAVLMSGAAAGAAVSSKGRLKPVPPNPLPAHAHPGTPSAHRRSGLPNTGINARVETAVALLMLGCGALAKAYSVTRPAARTRRR
jgi:hypothetical protein